MKQNEKKIKSSNKEPLNEKETSFLDEKKKILNLSLTSVTSL